MTVRPLTTPGTPPTDGQSQGPESRHNCKVRNNDKFGFDETHGIAGDCGHDNKFNLGCDELIKMNKSICDNELDDNGDGSIIDNSMHVTNPMCYIQQESDISFALGHTVNSSSANAGDDKLCLVNRMFIKVHDSEGSPSNMVSLHAVDEHRGILGHNTNQNHPNMAKMSTFEHVIMANGHRTNIIYVHDQTAEGIRDYYYLTENDQGFTQFIPLCSPT